METTNTQRETDALNVIKEVHDYTRSNSVLGFLKNSFLVLLEIACYTATVLLVYLAISMSNGIITASKELNDSVTIDYQVKIKELMNLFMTIRIMLIVLGTVPFLMALLFRKIRKKNRILKKVNEKTDDFLERYNY